MVFLGRPNAEPVVSPSIVVSGLDISAYTAECGGIRCLARLETILSKIQDCLNEQWCSRLMLILAPRSSLDSRILTMELLRYEMP